jgi:transcription antitermination factor NusG
MFSQEDFNKFIENFNNQDAIFAEYSQIFKKFWETLILNDNVKSLDESDMDPIIRIIDCKAKGNTKESICIALDGIRMGQWYRAFRSIKENKEIRNIICKVFKLKNSNDLIMCLNDLEKINSGLGNGLTARNAIIINALLCLNDPNNYLSSLSLSHRNKMVKYLYNTDEKNETFGEKVINSNKMILEYFQKNNIIASPRTISCFLYKIRNLWDNDSDIIKEEIEINDNINDEQQIFVLEKYLEDFLIGNWESTELGKKYSLIYNDDGELLSQQYKTDIGKIDLLVKEKKTNNYVVIELKKNQTSDDTIGQISRYMGWVKEKLAKNGIVKGLIIGYLKDEKLYYALKSVPNIELLLYRINFTLINP